MSVRSHSHPPFTPSSDPLLDRVREAVRTCIQCGTCTGSCPNAFAMDMTPRELWRMVLMGLTPDIFHSRTFALCSACYRCTLRCPRGLALTDAMDSLKQIAAREAPRHDPTGTAFHHLFMESVRRNGRVRETWLMAKYMAAVGPRNPGLPAGMTPLGLRLLRKGKLSFRPPADRHPLDRLFRRVEELTAPPEAGVRKE